jgi:hypothetical protein
MPNWMVFLQTHLSHKQFEAAQRLVVMLRITWQVSRAVLAGARTKT